MPRTIESILDCHHAAQERRAAGQPVWDHIVNVAPIFHRKDLTFNERRDEIVAVLRSHPWVTPDTMHGWDLQDLVAELTDTCTEHEFDQVWDAIYDEADCDRVWIRRADQ